MRAGFILTCGDIAILAKQNGLGVRHGERQFVLRALLEQEPAAALCWLAGHARRAARQHQRRAGNGGAPGHRVDRWWAERATGSARVLGALARRARDAASLPPGASGWAASPGKGHRGKPQAYLWLG